jgi:hypothetical protein
MNEGGSGDSSEHAVGYTAGRPYMILRGQDWFEVTGEGGPVETLCAWCGRFQNPDGSWGRPTSNRFLKPASHGICPECALAEMRAEGETN